MSHERILNHLVNVLAVKNLTIDSTLRDLASTYTIEDELAAELERRISNSPDTLAALNHYYSDLSLTLKDYDEENVFMELHSGEYVKTSSNIRNNINAGKLIQIRNYPNELYVNEELDDSMFIDQLESRLEKLARFYCTVTYLPKLSRKIKSFMNVGVADLKESQVSNNLPFDSVTLNLMFMNEMGMLHKILKQKPSKAVELITRLFPGLKEQSQTISRVLSAIRNNNITDKNHPYYTPGNRKKVEAEMKKYMS